VVGRMWFSLLNAMALEVDAQSSRLQSSGLGPDRADQNAVRLSKMH
jgi:hypothetical protein